MSYNQRVSRPQSVLRKQRLPLAQFDSLRQYFEDNFKKLKAGRRQLSEQVNGDNDEGEENEAENSEQTTQRRTRKKA